MKKNIIFLVLAICLLPALMQAGGQEVIAAVKFRVKEYPGDKKTPADY
jgi:hypothetical protein